MKAVFSLINSDQFFSFYTSNWCILYAHVLVVSIATIKLTVSFFFSFIFRGSIVWFCTVTCWVTNLIITCPPKKTAKQHVNPIIIIIPSQLGEDDDNKNDADTKGLVKKPDGKSNKPKSKKPDNSTQREKRSQSNQVNAVKHFCLSMLWTYMNNIVSFDVVLEEEFVFVCF